MKRKFAAVLAVILMVCAWHACCYDRATWYGGSDRGKLMADGRPFNPDALTAASWDYPLGSKLKIVYGNKSVRVEVTDKGGKRAFLQFGKVVDLSHAAFARLAKPEVGSIRVTIRRED
ncbi:MAG: septal ring lytic transglycosylase RlpA family protein [Verrucomicrobiota bacterium]|jgi:rare lipoprotein A